MKGSSACIYTFLASVLTLIIVANAIVVLYACLLWDDYEEINAKFVVGIIIFIGCTTLPFALITGYLVRNRFIYLDKVQLVIFLLYVRCIRHLRRADAFSSLNLLMKDGKYRLSNRVMRRRRLKKNLQGLICFQKPSWTTTLHPF